MLQNTVRRTYSLILTRTFDFYYRFPVHDKFCFQSIVSSLSFIFLPTILTVLLCCVLLNIFCKLQKSEETFFTFFYFVRSMIICRRLLELNLNWRQDFHGLLFSERMFPIPCNLNFLKGWNAILS